jgi:glycosyltransferase involved in cell wall biosynthesis
VHRAAFRYVAEDAESGYGDAADRLVRATRALGSTVELRGWPDVRNGAEPALVPFSRDSQPRDRAPVGAPTVVHLVPEHYPLVRSVVLPGPFVAQTVWESDRLPHHWPALLDATDLVIVPTEWNREVFVASGVRTPVVVVPHVATAVEPGDAGAGLRLADDDFVFYTIGRWNERKALFLAVRAYLDAFTGDDPVVLVVKTNPNIEMPATDDWGAGNALRWTTAWQVLSIVREYRNPARVQVEAETWTQARIAGLHTRGDCFVSLSHGEGWGFGAFDATAFGNPVVATGWSAFLEYLDADTAFLVDHELVPVRHSALASYTPDQRWAEPEVAHATALLREVAADPVRARARAAPARDRVLHDYAPKRVARQFLDVLPA